MKYKKIGCIADDTIQAKEAFTYFSSNYDLQELTKESRKEFDMIMVLGGDGFMLHTLHQYMDLNIPFFGMNVGTLGFLLNEYRRDDFLDRISKFKPTVIHPLRMRAKLANGEEEIRLAINEVSLLRTSTQAAKLKISVNGSVRLLELVCDGAIVATPAGSSAYNFSVGGSIIPLGSNILALTPISPFRPRRWGGALLPHDAKITLDVLDHHKRPMNAVADFNEIKNVVSVTVEEISNKEIILLFDPDHSLEDRITKEQFA